LFPFAVNRLSHSVVIAVALGFLTALSSVMLGLGQNDSLLPAMMCSAAIASLLLTDYHRVIRLGDWTVNVLVLIIVFCTIGEVVHRRGEDLAMSIARVLVFVEMVLVFREKKTEYCWQILLISFLQVVVATALQQSILFGCLLILYVFVGFWAFVLIFLQQENHYFRQHSFLSTFLESIKAEIAERQDRGKLIRIALMTLLMGPLSLIMSFDRKKTTAPTGQKSPRDILRSLFMVFPSENDLKGDHWETIDEAAMDKARQDELVAASVVGVKTAHRRFALLAENPGFSAGTRNVHPLEGGWLELLGHLISGTLFALIVAILLFCLIPRIGRVDFGELTLKPGYSQWTQPIAKPVGTVGFKDEIRLGSLGTVIPHHREVMIVQFTKCDNDISREAIDTSQPYEEIAGATLYFRGVMLDIYSGGAWSQHPVRQSFLSRERQQMERLEGQNSDDIAADSVHPRHTPVPYHVLRPGRMILPEEINRIYFEDGTDPVFLSMKIQPLDTTVFFAPWPFFSLGLNGEPILKPGDGRIEEIRQRGFEMTKTILSTAFRRGTQLDLVPCQEFVEQHELLQVPSVGLDALKKLAKKWDAESKCSKNDIVGRARYMEQQFLQSGHFSYKLGGTVRDFDLDPLEDFVTNNPKGHCEYFAGALVMMLRSVGIGARVIVGFKTEVPNDSTQCMVRQSDAHSWVEVHLPLESISGAIKGRHPDWWTQGGWLRLDPSPASAPPTGIQSISLGLTDFNLWVQKMWNDMVLNMNSSRQMQAIYLPISKSFYYVVDRVFNWQYWKRFFFETIDCYRLMFLSGNNFRWQFGDWLRLGVLGLFLTMIAYALGRILWKHRYWFQKTTETERRRRTTIEFYLRMEHLLARLGHTRRFGETPLEFIRQSDFFPMTSPVVNAFYRVRFGNAILSNEEIGTIRETLDQLEQKAVDLNRAQ
jgi:hypothetical protein